jgi:hypothetical protein
MNAQQTTKTKGCCSENASSIRSVITITGIAIRSTLIAISIGTVLGATTGAVIGAAMDDVVSGVAWGFGAGAFVPSILIAMGCIKIKTQ